MCFAEYLSTHTLTTSRNDRRKREKLEKKSLFAEKDEEGVDGI
jgi:hypothetical protein